MSPKPPAKGTVTVDVHTRPNSPSDGHTPLPDTLPRIDFGSPITTNPRNLPKATGTPGDVDLDAITPAPTVTASETHSSPAPAPTTAQRPLEHYWVTGAAQLPAPDAQGFRTFKGRQYVDVPGGGIVHIGADPDTGLYRAKLRSELQASGPVLVRDPETTLWHLLDDLEPTTYPLTATRLEAFRTNLDLTGVEPGSDGLYRRDGKLYAVIQNRAYQALHDLEASSPQASVMRIVRAEDPVALDEHNVYIATRPGRSEPVVYDVLDGWRGTELPGAGGMMRGEPDRTARQGLADRLSSAYNRLRSPESRAAKLYPSLSEEQISAFVRSLGDDIQGGLSRRETEYKTLKAQLTSWIKQSSTSSTPEATKRWAERIAQEIKRGWHQQTGTTLKLEPGNGTLPALKADFSHIRTLDLNAVTWSDTADTFLASFSRLERLTVTRSTLDKLPAAVAEMSDLSRLDLSSNRIQLNEQTKTKLSALSKLEHIDLSGNPLGSTPDFSTMSELKTLNLSNTQLDQWPAGLQHQAKLEIVDLRNNQLREVPQTHLNPAADQLESIARINGVTLLEGNPFPAGYWRSFEMLWQRIAADHPELSIIARTGTFRIDGNIPEIAMVQRMYPDKDAQAAREYLIGLGDGAEREIARRIQAFDLLETQLGHYIADRQAGSSSTADAEQTQAKRLARIIKGCWLEDSGAVLRLPDVNGPLPALTVSFSHVKILSMDLFSSSDATDTFLSNFPNLESLSITHSQVERLPPSIGEMKKLSFLSLTSNNLTLDAQSASTLSAMTQLAVVDLSKNPLQIAPDFSAMSKLNSVSLHDTQISEWPTGLLDKTALTGLDLSNNRLREVPQANLKPAPEQLQAVARINAVTRLEDNPFPSQYWRKFDSYWRRLNETHPELMSPADSKAFDSKNSWAQRYRKLYPSKSIKACREYIWSHEKGTFSPKLNVLEQEFSLLKDQLDAWVYSGGGNQQRYIRVNQLQINAQTRNDRTKARDRIISCWRRETPQQLAHDGAPIGLELDLGGLILPTLPDLSIDFSHVGSLKLNNMNLTASPEGFLTRFRHLRWLNMSNNRLRDLPPAVGEMHAMTRLFLHNNQLELTAETARILFGRTTLRALSLNGNPQLGVLPDFSLISDIRSVHLGNTGINSWPTGLFDQPLLTDIDLSNNQLTTIPDFVIAPSADRLAHSVQVNSGTLVANNPLSDATRLQLGVYRQRLTDAGTRLNRTPNLFTTSSPDARRPEPVARAVELHPLWLVGLSADKVSTRTEQWRMLREQQGSDGFFNIIQSRTGHPDFRRQVWEVIDVITENNTQSRALRRELFARACEAGCTDLAAATFTDLQILAISHKARIQAKLELNGTQLVDLSKGLFRLKQVDDIAAADLESSRAIVSDPTTSAEQRTHHRNRIHDPHEMTMAYRFGLKDRLQLPFQPETLSFIGMANVTPTMLDAAYRKVVALDGSPEVFEALVSMDFWQDFITHKYQSQFEDSRQPFQDRQAILDEQKSQGKLTESEYKTRTDDLQAQHAIAEATLIQTLTRQELQPDPTIEGRPASDTPENEATPGAD
ncbi:hypothetical protein PS838_00085 [Pseudomonas fluorescens]|nr:hypothetical protein PS838_00085 [Pseudomonas fluorescens]